MTTTARGPATSMLAVPQHLSDELQNAVGHLMLAHGRIAKNLCQNPDELADDIIYAVACARINGSAGFLCHDHHTWRFEDQDDRRVYWLCDDCGLLTWTPHRDDAGFAIDGPPTDANEPIGTDVEVAISILNAPDA